jgi:ERF superfamily
MVVPEKCRRAKDAETNLKRRGTLMRKQASPAAATEQRQDTSAGLLTAPPGDNASTVLALINRVALDACADVEKLDRVMALYERLKAKEAELQYNAAKGRILKKLAGIKIVKNRPALYEIEKGKPQNGTCETFKYASLEEIDKHLRPLLAEEEMDLSYSDEPLASGGILICGRLKHLPSGHYEDSFMPAPLDTTGGKSEVQAVGSTNSFLRRYVLCNIFNIVVVGDDDDGTGGTINEAKTQTILDLIKKAKVGTKFLKYMKAQSVEEAGSLEAAVATIAARDYQKAVSTLEEHIAKTEATHARLS